MCSPIPLLNSQLTPKIKDALRQPNIHTLEGWIKRAELKALILDSFGMLAKRNDNDEEELEYLANDDEGNRMGCLTDSQIPIENPWFRRL